MAQRESLKIGKHTVDITNPDRVLFPKSKITKGDLIAYYAKISSTMLPYMKDRPVTMLRFVEGISKEGFYQKDAPPYFPAWIKRKAIKKENGDAVHYVLCNNPETLIYLANQAVVTPHLWLSRIDKLNYPDRLIFDLDPGSKTKFSYIMKTAKKLKLILEDHGLVPFVMTTGSRGLHIVCPLKRTATFDKVRAFAREIATQMAADDPEHLTVSVRKAARKGRMFIDYLRNSYGATGVSPYAVRAIEKAPVATPLDWSELTARLTPQKYNIKNMFARLKKRGDPWQDIDKSARSIKK